MELFRSVETVADGNYNVGDVIAFSLTDCEEVEALAVKQEPDGMIFCLVDCLADKSPMNQEDSNRGGYDVSDLRERLQSVTLDRFPAEIREKMVAFSNGDLLRLPTEREIFGCNKYGQTEADSVIQWEPMKQRRNRIALQGGNGDLVWYWLENKTRYNTGCFTEVGNIGNANYDSASAALGVRPTFKLQNDSVSWHTDERDDGAKGIGDAYERCPLAFVLHLADEVASLLVEKRETCQR